MWKLPTAHLQEDLKYIQNMLTWQIMLTWVLTNMGSHLQDLVHLLEPKRCRGGIIKHDACGEVDGRPVGIDKGCADGVTGRYNGWGGA